MADIYVSSISGNNSNSGLTWATSKATVSGALAVVGSGQNVYVSKNHYETTSGVLSLLNPSGNILNPTRILCVEDNVEPPTTLATGAVVRTSTNQDISMPQNSCYIYGMTFCTSGSFRHNTTPLNFDLVYENCYMSGLFWDAGNTSIARHRMQLINTPMEFIVGGLGIRLNGEFIWENTPNPVRGVIPTTLFSTAGSWPLEEVGLYGLDLSAISGGKNLMTPGSTLNSSYYIQNCKFHSGVNLFSAANGGDVTIRIINSDFQNTTYTYRKINYFGEIRSETGIIRNNGASNGITPISHKVISSGNTPTFFKPLVTDPILYWNTVTGTPITAKLNIITNNIQLKNSDVWMETEYLGNQNTLSSFISTRPSGILTSGTNLTSGTAIWTTTGLFTGFPQEISTTFTPQQIGLIRTKVKVARRGITFYLCPKLEIS